MAENLLADLMGSLLIVAPAAFGIVFAYWLYKKLCKISLFRQSREDDEALLRRMEMADAGEAEADSYQKLRQIYRDIQAGAKAFLAAEYRMCLAFLAVFGVAMIFFVAKVESGWDFKIGTLTAFSFFVGGITSMISGYIGMMIAVFTNARCTMCATQTPDSLAWKESFNSAFRGGAVMGFALAGLGILVMYFLMCMYVSAFDVAVEAVKLFECIAGFGLGGSAIAMFGRVGGGIYTKAADVGADLAGKVVAGIPEDDPRNPAVVADLVGDNVGDCSARGADLFESIAAEVISAMILGATMAKKANIPDSTGFIMFPLVVHALDCLVSAAGIMSVGEKPSLNPNGGRKEDPYEVLKGGYAVAMGLSVVGFGIATRVMLYVEDAPSAWFHFFGCGMIGTASAYAFVFIAQYYTDYKYPPVRVIAEASTTGHGTNIIAGVGVGMESTAAPVICISAAIVSAYWFGQTSGLTDKSTGEPTGGLFGTAVATMGMLSTAAYVLTMDVFGPIADNAGGIVEMSDQPESVRECTDALDAVGNTTKATTKGYAIGSAALASFLLFSAYMDEVEAFTGKPFKQVDIAVPEVFVAGLLGSMIVYLFTAFACTAVGRSAQEVVTEVRRQFAERPGIMSREEKPDYGRCVSIVARSALREMIKPGVLAVGAPVAVGVAFRLIGRATGQELLGARAVAGMLMFATVAGILMALFLNTAGGAWDNAKKYVETGAHGGKNSEAHKAAVTGDTVGDPFKDTAGPSIHVLIKMLATITLVMAPMFLD
mmetsp:Transcript_6744/g.26251  ORF Transcript_6744/g.26251 Transcript_6744/m.26251 type:complete len:769 (-) Transcript_6744:123-2429(-)